MMGMPITVEIADNTATAAAIDSVFDYFKYIDEKFSTYKDTSEISHINQNVLQPVDYSDDMKTVFALSEETKKLTNGFFDIQHKGNYDTSGLVKGWAIHNAAQLLKDQGFKNFYVEAGGDIEVYGKNSEGKAWRVGIRNPFNREENVKVIFLGHNEGVATSGTYIRGQHVYNPKNDQPITDIVSLTVVGPDIYEADRFATAAFAMGKEGIMFIEGLKGFEGYMIDAKGVATLTSGFDTYSR